MPLGYLSCSVTKTPHTPPLVSVGSSQENLLYIPLLLFCLSELTYCCLSRKVFPVIFQEMYPSRTGII